MKAENRSFQPHLYALSLIVLLTTTIIVYYPSLHYEFVFDDTANITQLYNIRNFTFTELFCSGTRWISYWLNSVYYKIDQFNPFPYRCGNLIIHLINGFLVFCLLYCGLVHSTYRFFSQNAWWLAWLTSSLFLIHPVQTQTVSYIIQGQLEGTASLCILLLALCFILYYQMRNIAARFVTLCTMIFAAFCASGTKEIAIITPILLLLTDWFFVAQGSLKKIKEHYAIHGLISSLIVGMYLYFLRPSFFIKLLTLQHTAHNNLGNVITREAFDAITPYQYCISQFQVIVHYLWIFLWPFDISVEYDWKLVSGFFSFDCIVPLLLLLLMSYYVIRLLRTKPTHPIGFGALWFMLAILPRSSIVPSCELIVDYKTYLASPGLLFVVASGLLYASTIIMQPLSFAPLNHYKKTYYGSSLALLLCILSTTTIHRNTVWHSPLEFWANMLKNAPNKARVQNNYGVELSQLGRFQEAIPYLKKAIQLDRFYRDPYNNLAVAYGSTKQIDLAIQTLVQALRIHPHYAEAYNNIGSFFIDKKEYAHALESLNKAVALKPAYGKAYYNKGRLFAVQKDYHAAYEQLKYACTKADLDNELGFSSFARACTQINKYDEALDAWKKVTQINPSNMQAWFNLGNMYHLVQQYENAIKTFHHVLAHNENNARIYYNLAESYFMTGQAEKALLYFNKAPFSLEQMPHLYIRKADCYHILGRHDKVRELSSLILANNHVAQEFKDVAQELLNKLSIT